MTVGEIYEMELWEFNLYIQTFNKRKKEEYKNIITLAYNTGAFTSVMSYGKKQPKDLSYYLDRIDEIDEQKSNKRSKEEFKEAVKKLKERSKQIQERGG